MKYIPFAIFLLLMGCAPVIKQGAPVSDHVVFPSEVSKSIHGLGRKDEAALPEKWWSQFDDPNLDRMVDIALKSNPSLAEAKDRLSRAQAVVMESESLRYPHVDSVNRITRQRLSRNGNHTIYNGKTATIANVFPFSLNYDLDLWHRDEEIISASQATEEVALARYRLSALMLSSAVIKTYFALNVASRLASLQKELISIAEDESRLYGAAYRSGVMPASPSLAADGEIRQDKKNLAILQRRADGLRYALLELLGRAPGDDLPETAQAQIPDRFAIPKKIGLDLVAQRPDVQAALWNVRKQVHLEKAARDAFYPNINLFALAGFNSIGLFDLLGPGGANYAYGPAVNLPIFEGGELEGRLHAQESSYDLAVHAYNRTLLSAARQIADALSELKYSRSRLEDGSAKLELKISQAGIAASGYESGITGKLPLLAAQIDLHREQMSHLEDSLDWLNSITYVATALGGGFGKWPS